MSMCEMPDSVPIVMKDAYYIIYGQVHGNNRIHFIHTLVEPHERDLDECGAKINFMDLSAEDGIYFDFITTWESITELRFIINHIESKLKTL